MFTKRFDKFILVHKNIIVVVKSMSSFSQYTGSIHK